MVTLSSTNIALPKKYSILLFLSLIAAGLAGNYFNFQVFYSINFLFGSIFAMLALQFFGLGRGIAAAAIVAGYTYILWNHPYAIIIMTAEAAVVGWLMTRRKMELAQADTLFWLAVGMPMVYLFYHVVMHVPFSNTSIAMTKLAVNGIANALIARLIFIVYALWSRSSLTSYREIVSNLLTCFVLFPALFLLGLGSRSDFAATDRHVRTTLIQDSRRVTDRVDIWLVNRRSAIITMAEMAEVKTPEQMQPYLELAKKTDVNFQQVGLMDREATSVVFYPPVDELGKSSVGKSYADRSYIPTLKQTLKPLLSEVVIGRIGNPRPIVVQLAPVVQGGEYNGFVAGVLGLEQIRDHLDKSTDADGALYTLLDKNGNVIMSNHPEQKVMTPFERGKGTLNRLDEGISQWVPILLPNTPPTERWQQSFYIAETAIGNSAEWKLILEQPVAPFQKELYKNYTGKLTLLFLILLVALALGEFLSRRIVVTLEKLRLITHDLPVKLTMGGSKIVWPESSIREVNHLVGNFKTMGGVLSEQFDEVRRSNELLEQRVEERTRALRESEDKFRTVADYTYGWEVWEGPDGSWRYCSPVCERITGYSSERFLADPGLLERLIYPEDRLHWNEHHLTMHRKARIQAVFTRPASELDFRIVRPDGEIRWISHLCHHIYDAEGHDLGYRISNRDITERKSLEDEVVKIRNLESLGILAGGIAHDFNNLFQGILGNLQLAKMNTEQSSSAFPFLEQAEQVSGLATRLVRQFVAFSPGGNFQPIVIQPVGVIREEANATLEGSGLVIEFDLAESLWSVSVDPAQFRNVIKQMVQNAMEATVPEPGGKLWIIATNEPEQHEKPPTLAPGDYVKISIRDQGRGISSEHLPRIFDPYFSTKARGSQKGMGLGLALCDAIIRRHGGVITVQSTPGAGAVFHIYLPAVVDQVEK